MATARYLSPLGEMLLAADDVGLTGAWFVGQKYFPAEVDAGGAGETALRQAESWLDAYFSGHDPGTLPALHLMGTPFQTAVWRLLLGIPYGQTTTYGALAAAMAAQTGRRPAAQAVGGAVGHNPISIIVPCHRVLGANGSLTGYAGGLDKKQRLLALEKLSHNI